MPNYYTETSFLIPYPEGVEKNVVEDFIVNELGEDDDYTLEIRLEPAGIWFWSENLDIDEAVGTVQKLLHEFYPDDFKVMVSWADYSSKPRLNSFSGGAMIITKNHDQIFDPVMQAISYAKAI